jgi:DNA-binding GntR family transcriptional regulator
MFGSWLAVYKVIMRALHSDLHILQTRSISDLVRDELLRLIKSGEIGAGDKLSELAFAQHFKTSRAPIREAFRALEEAGLVKLEKNRGVFVRKIEEPEAYELYELRASLDELTGRRLAVRITRGEIDELHGWITRLEHVATSGDMSAYFPLNIAFHDRIVEMAGSITLLELYRRVIDRMHLLRRLNFSVTYGSQASQAEHRAIVGGLESGQPERAAQAMRAHVINGYDRLTAVRKQ